MEHYQCILELYHQFHFQGNFFFVFRDNILEIYFLFFYSRLGLHRSNGMRTLENSSSSEEEDRTDLLGRNFQVPRPKSRSNGSVTVI